MEASAHPEKADAAATLLRTAVPAAGHLVHMPAHIDVQLGRWALASDQNVQAVEADRRYRRISPRQGFYRIYMAHNHHFLAFASMMEGRSEVALQAARDMIAGVPADYIREQGAHIDPYMMIALDVLKRFGRWDDILDEPRPPQELPITTALWHASRGIAYAAQGQIDDAQRAQTDFRTAAEAVPPDAMMAINRAHDVLAIADLVLEGEIAYRRGDIDLAVSKLRQGVEREDQLRYMEPPEWTLPVRHTLGAVLVSARRYDEAEAVYRKDLEVWPENGWSLRGLADCLEARGRTNEAVDIERRFAEVWRRADVKIGSSCLCVPGHAQAPRPDQTAPVSADPLAASGAGG
jgi:tetratricopeptide (TPR) repeat protein